PLRNQLTLAVDHAFDARWSARGTVRYRASHYRKSNRVLDPDGTLRSLWRIEQLAQADVQVRRRLGPTLNALLEYQFSFNDSTIDAFNYRRHLGLVGVEWTPR